MKIAEKQGAEPKAETPTAAPTSPAASPPGFATSTPSPIPAWRTATIPPERAPDAANPGYQPQTGRQGRAKFQSALA